MLEGVGARVEAEEPSPVDLLTCRPDRIRQAVIHALFPKEVKTIVAAKWAQRGAHRRSVSRLAVITLATAIARGVTRCSPPRSTMLPCFGSVLPKPARSPATSTREGRGPAVVGRRTVGQDLRVLPWPVLTCPQERIQVEC